MDVAPGKLVIPGIQYGWGENKHLGLQEPFQTSNGQRTGARKARYILRKLVIMRPLKLQPSFIHLFPYPEIY